MLTHRWFVVSSFALASAALVACTEEAQAAGSASDVQTQALSTGAAEGGAGHRHHGPPAEAFEACTGKAAGDACSVTLHAQALAGTCLAPPAGASDAVRSRIRLAKTALKSAIEADPALLEELWSGTEEER